VAVQRRGFVGKRTESLSLSGQQSRLTNAIRAAAPGVTLDSLQAMVSQFSGAKRLSTTFRFADGSTRLDSRSQQNIERLAHQIETGDFDGHTLIFAGFTDADGDSNANIRISRQRAGLVASAVKAAAVRANPARVTMQINGMGEISPLACDDTALGRRTNRRVEVWLK